MHMPQFDPETLTRQLNAFDARKQVLFGWACCCRLQPNIRRFQEDVGLRLATSALTDALQQALRFVKDGTKGSASEIRKLAATCEALAPRSEDVDSLYTTAAQEAMFSLCYLLDFMMEQDLDLLVNTARYPTDSIDLYVQEIEDMYPQDPELERKILNHRLMQQELRRQQRDLSEIADLRLDDAPALEAFVTRARSEDCLE